MNYSAPLIQENVAVIGSGIAGCLAALELARAGYRVRIFEELDHPFSGTSATALQAHLGGLYSGNMETAKECLHSAIEVKKVMPYMLSDRNATFLVAQQSEMRMNEFVTFYEQLRDYYDTLPDEDKVFGEPKDFFRIITSEDYPFAKNIEGGIVTHEPGLDMEKARDVLLEMLAELGVEIATNTEVMTAEKRPEGEFILSIKAGNDTSEYRCMQVVNAGGYKCRLLDFQLGDRTSYSLSLEAKCIVRDVTPSAPMPAFYVVRGGFIHITPIGDGRLSCLNTGTKDGGYIDTMILDNENTRIPSEWQEIMATGRIPDAEKRQQAMIEYANSNFLVDRQLEPVALVPGISTSFSSVRQNRTQRKVTIVTPGWQTIVPTKATHALELARQALDNAREYSVQLGNVRIK